MNELDEMLKSFQGIVDAHQEAEPLLDASIYKSDRKSANRDAGSIYLGCIGLWLLERQGFADHRTKSNVEFVKPAGSIRVTPGQFAKQTLNQKLFISDVSDGFKEFIEKYVRGTAAYSSDYTDSNVVRMARLDMFDVTDEVGVYEGTRSAIEGRYLAYKKGDPNWSSVGSIYKEISLSDGEKNIDGWVSAFNECLNLTASTEIVRRENLNKFWALVDYSPNLKSPLVPELLLKSFSASASSSVQESVINALRECDFSATLAAIIADAVRLQHSGKWLESLLGMWDDTSLEKNIREFENQLVASSDEARGAIQLAVEDGLLNRAEWARIAKTALNKK